MAFLAEVAQLVERGTENPGVAGSIPALGTTFLAEDAAPGLVDRNSFLAQRAVIRRECFQVQA